MKILREFEKFGPRSNHKTEKLNNVVWGYTRVSSKDQFVNKSLKNQDRFIRECVQENGWVLAKIFGGTYESASGDFTRKEFMKLIKEVKASRKRPYAIVIYKLSRFSRTGGDAIKIATELIEHLGVHLYEISTGKNTFSEHGKLDIFEGLIEARRETVNKLELTIPGMREFVADGNVMGKAPKWWDHYGPRVKDKSKVSGNQKIVLNAQGKKLKKAWDWKHRYWYSDVIISQKLKEIGITASPKFLGNMWRKPFYAGISMGKWTDHEPIKGNWEPMVSPKVFLEINRRLNDVNPNGWKIRAHDDQYPLSNFVKCGKCGSHLVAYSVNKKRKSDGHKYKINYYRCNYCTGMNINAKSSQNSVRKGAHELFTDLLSKYSLDPKFRSSFIEQLQLTFDKLNKDQMNDQKLILETLSKKKDQLKKVKRRFALGEFDDREIYNELTSELSKEIVQLEEQSGISGTKLSNREFFIEKSCDILENLSDYWNSGESKIKQMIQKTVFPNGIALNSEKTDYLTDSVNLVFELIRRLSIINGKEKRADSNLKLETTLLVARGGLEPPTS